MSRVIVIEGSGRVGSYLIPRLVELGHAVVNVSRGQAKPYAPHYTSLAAIYQSLCANGILSSA